jgi:hypothetical protein
MTRQEFRAGIHARFAVSADAANPNGWMTYLWALADTRQLPEYLAVARRCANRFDNSEFAIRLADALERSGDQAEALRIIERLRQRVPDDVPGRLAEAVLLLKSGDAGQLLRATSLLDDAATILRTAKDEHLETDCEVLRACVQWIRGDAVLGGIMLENVRRRAPNNPRVLAITSATNEQVQ